ncbi:hypothetical protein BKA66DRAFT_285839 [Pyrenochaeta sp. MPI-SDFR-AT-0127]|nr:hypothetical protein BKA66DRAFT_285839 [Pyrenochaeta sp. MPI-SDFR-AT-0127]
MDNTPPHPPAAGARMRGSFPASTASDTGLAAVNALSSNTLDIVLVSQSQSINIGQQAQRSIRKRREGEKRAKTQTTDLPGYLCFSLLGEPVKAPQRSAFSAVRREQVKRLRKQGACLRCKLMKRACSGENPCNRCLDVVNAAAGSRVLIWMDCIRPSFDSMNIFSHGMSLRDPARLRGLMAQLGNESINLDFQFPFEMNIDESSAYLARWLIDYSAHSKISLIGLLSTSEFSNLINDAVGEPLGESLRLMVHLTTQISGSSENTEYRGTPLGDIRMMRDHAGCQILSTLDERLKPQQLEISPNKLTNLKGLFLLVLGTAVATRYAFTNTPANDIQDKEKALLRLLCHYFVYIGNAISLLDRSCDPTDLLSKWTYEWNKPAVFGWQIFKDSPKQEWDGDPFAQPSKFPIAFTESLGDIPASLNDSSIFEMFTEPVACTNCGTLGPFTDINGCCGNCGPAFSMEDIEWAPFDPPVACTNCGTLGPFTDINGRCGNCGPAFSMEDIEWAPFDPPIAIPTNSYNEVSGVLLSDFDSPTWPAWNQIPTTNDFPWLQGMPSTELHQAVYTATPPPWDPTSITNDFPRFPGVSSAEEAQPVPEPAALTSEPWSWTVRRTETLPSADDPPPSLGALCFSPGLNWQTEPSGKGSNSHDAHSERKNKRKRNQNVKREEPAYVKRARQRREEDRVEITVDYPCPRCSKRFCKFEKRRQARRLLNEHRKDSSQTKELTADVKRD